MSLVAGDLDDDARGIAVDALKDERRPWPAYDMVPCSIRRCQTDLYSPDPSPMERFPIPMGEMGEGRVDEVCGLLVVRR